MAGKDFKSNKKESIFGLENKPAVLKELERLDPDQMTLTDAMDMISKTKVLHDEIDKKLDEIFQKTGWSTKQIKMHLDNPNNFTSEEWERVQKERQKLLNSLKTEQELKAPEKGELKPEQATKLNKERRSKTIGARRNWISMQ
jgi:hypothetical protein